MRKLIAALLTLTLALTALVSAWAEASEKPGFDYTALLADLLTAYQNGTNIDAEIAGLEDEVAIAVAEHWRKVYLDPGYRLYIYGRDDPAELPVTGAHAFVVLGYELKNGEMAPELMGRCDAAAAAARAFPDSILVCSGGATGINNPEKHTEAGMMRDYLVEKCGIAPERVFTDEQAMTTAENAINTFVILQAQGIETMTIVTSAYHQRWGQTLYNAMAAKYRQEFGYEAEIVGNFCLDIEPENPMFQNDAMIAAMQLGRILRLPVAPAVTTPLQ